MPGGLDRRLAGFIVGRLRRNWPVLRLVPAPWLVPIITPAARHLRCEIVRGAAAVVAVFGVFMAVMTLVA
jgi:hypothetical protein